MKNIHPLILRKYSLWSLWQNLPGVWYCRLCKKKKKLFYFHVTSSTFTHTETQTDTHSLLPSASEVTTVLDRLCCSFSAPQPPTDNKVLSSKQKPAGLVLIWVFLIARCLCQRANKTNQCFPCQLRAEGHLETAAAYCRDSHPLLVFVSQSGLW